MKKELKMKHGVILATAVLLIAGIAFAGAAAAEPVYVDWDETLINSTGGDFIIKDLPNGELSGLYQDAGNQLVLNNNLTLDFHYQTVRLKDSISDDGYEGGVFGNITIGANKKILTIKNLIIDGGELVAKSVTGGDKWTTGMGGIIGVFYPLLTSYGCVYLENISIRNISLKTTDNKIAGCGGLIGVSYGPTLTITNCSIANSTISSPTYAGGIVGYPSSGGSTTVKSSIVDGCYISGAFAGGLFAENFQNVATNDVVVENSVIYSTSGYCGGILGSSYMGLTTSDTSVKNCVILSSDSDAAGVLGSMRANNGGERRGNFNIASTMVTNSTIVGKSVASGFIGNFVSAGSNPLSIDSNKVCNSCVVATGGTSGVAAGFIAKDLSA